MAEEELYQERWEEEYLEQREELYQDQLDDWYPMYSEDEEDKTDTINTNNQATTFN